MGVLLEVLFKGVKEKSFRLDEEGAYVLGRSAKADFHLAEPKLSGMHCAFVLEDGKLFVEDLRSTNGTIIDGIHYHGTEQLPSQETSEEPTVIGDAYSEEDEAPTKGGPVQISDGSVIEIGATQILIHSSDEDLDATNA